ncbi:MAG TPA: hypothetical protein VF262_12080 [Burkholderiales bacterium]|jgi:predicted membrane GTPase involved in stress response
MSYDLPIQQTVRRVDTRFQLGFATEAKERIPEGDGFVLSASRQGLHVLARNEDRLSVPVETLRLFYGPALEVSPPKVRFIEGVQVQEPIMHVRISLSEKRWLEPVRRALSARRASLEEEYLGLRHAVLRYEAPLARLIGLPAELLGLTDGNARYWIVLSHYALVTGDPGGNAA